MATKKKARKKAKKKAPASRKAKKPLKKAQAKAKAVAKKALKKKPVARRTRGKADSAELTGYKRKGLGSDSGGQSGDTQGIAGSADIDSESVEELLEEGQSFEAEVVSGIENAADPDISEVVTHEVPEDDVPEEYRDKD
jgi:membrane protein involved in colicin uptake